MVCGDYGELAQGLFLCVALGAGGLLFLSARARAWLSVTISKHVFEHRYDYRAEWMRFTATLAETGTETGGGGSNLYRRSAKALADLTGSPAALLMLPRSEEHTSELQSLMRISYAVFCLKKKKNEENRR